MKVSTELQYGIHLAHHQLQKLNRLHIGATLWSLHNWFAFALSQGAQIRVGQQSAQVAAAHLPHPKAIQSLWKQGSSNLQGFILTFSHCFDNLRGGGGPRQLQAAEEDEGPRSDGLMVVRQASRWDPGLVRCGDGDDVGGSIWRCGTD